MVPKNLCWKSVAVLIVFLGVLDLSAAATLRLLGRSSIDEFDEVELEDAPDLLSSPYYKSELNNFIYTFGFTGKVKGNYTVLVLSALMKLLDRNIFVLNWEKEASGITWLGNYGYIFSYVVSGTLNSILVGKQFGVALERMSNNGFNLSRTHAMGHSLGAHIMGNAGRYLISVGKSLSRISGCDPAGALYDKYIHILRPLDKSCADFVDTTHTDPGGYAMNSSVSDLDLWVNFGNFIYSPEEQQVQPGCAIGGFDMFTADDLCSHNRCLLLWIQTWSGATLQASAAVDYWTWQHDQVQGVVTDMVHLGDNTKTDAFGNYFMNTTGAPPYQPTNHGLRI